MSYTQLGSALAKEVLEAQRRVTDAFWYEWGSRYANLHEDRKAELQTELAQLLEACRAAGAAATVQRTIYSTHGSYTHTCQASTRLVYIEVFGAGGGGGASLGRVGHTTCAGGGGGGGGAYVAKMVMTAGSESMAITVGTGGAGATPAEEFGDEGSPSSVTVLGQTYSAGAGGGGQSMTAGNTYSIRGFGGAGVPGALGDIRIRGNEGWYGIRLDWEWFAAGRGGGTIYGGSHGTVGIDQEGSDGGGIGAGGGGAGSFENDHTGGAGHDGGVIITEYSNASASSTESGAEDATDDADYPVTISDGVIADFGAHRHLLVSGTGPLVGVDATGLIACTLLLSFTAACVVTAMGSPTSGSAIKTPRFGADTPQDLHVQADDVVEIRLRADAETPFWKVVGGSFT